jgi:Fe-S cluster assembly iron-binding protein IscA
MLNIHLTEGAKKELAPILKENAEKFLRLFIQGFG